MFYIINIFLYIAIIIYNILIYILLLLTIIGYYFDNIQIWMYKTRKNPIGHIEWKQRNQASIAWYKSKFIL